MVPWWVQVQRSKGCLARVNAWKMSLYVTFWLLGPRAWPEPETYLVMGTYEAVAMVPGVGSDFVAMVFLNTD